MLYLTALCLLATAGAWAAPQLIAHRGGTGDAPENTLPAIKLALENNAEAIWVTVQLSRDGVPVLYRSRRIAGAAAVGYQLWSGPGAGGGQQAKRGKYFLHDYIFLIYLLTQ